MQNEFNMDDNFSPRVKDVIAYSKEEALRLGHDFIGTEHLNARTSYEMATGKP